MNNTALVAVVKSVLALLLLLFLPALAQAQSACPVEIVSIRAAPQQGATGLPDTARWQPVTLPDDGRRHIDSDANTLWYEIDWRRNCAGAEKTRVAFVLQFMVMAGEVFLNGEQLWRDASLSEPMSRSWNTPRIWRLPEAQLRDGINVIRIRVVSVTGQALGLGPVFIGAPMAMQAVYDGLLWNYRTLFAISLIVSGILGVFFLALWLANRKESAFGWYALASIFWLIFVANVLATSPWPFRSTETASTVILVALILSIVTFCMFTWRLAGQHWPRIERGLWLLAAGLTLALLLLPFKFAPYVHLAVVLAVTLIFVVNCLQMPVHAWRTRNREHVLLALCLLVLLVTSLNDFLLVMKILPGPFPLLPYANIAVTLCLAGILGLRHAQNVRRIERFNVELTDKISEARSDLATTLEREYELALVNTRLQDRLQLAHALHDGLGGSLLHMMASVEQSPQQLQRERVLSMFKLLRDDLRQTIDSSSSEGIAAPASPREWIAPLRHRFTSLFDHFDMDGDWQVPEYWLGQPTAIQCLTLTRLVEEALTNAVRHSHASHVSLRISQESARDLKIEIEDDGVGFDVAAVRQSGLSVGIRSISNRIARLDGELCIESRPGRTLLTAQLALPG